MYYFCSYIKGIKKLTLLMTRMNIIFILLVLLYTTKLQAQNCSGFPAVSSMSPCAAASSTVSNNSNVNSGGTYSYCGNSNPTFSGINLSGGSIYICGNTTISGNFNSGKIFVACGATLTFSGGATFNSNVGIINYGTVIFSGSLTFQNSGNYIYNEGYSSKVQVNGNFNFPGNQVTGYLRNAGKVTVTGSLNLGAGGLICASPGSVISTGSFIYGTIGGNCNPSDAATNHLLFNGNTGHTILRYSGSAIIKGTVTNSAYVVVQRMGTAPTFPCTTSPASGWGSATVITSSIPALPTEPSQNACLVNGSVSCNTATALPVELVDFTASCEGNKVRLDWQTASERNNQYWIVERSTDLINIEKIATLDGAGNSTHNIDYSFEDANALGQLAYYRLSQYDYDGHKESFGWISINCGLKGDFNVFPNPSAGNFRITTTMELSGPAHYTVTDYSGKTVQEGSTELYPGNPLDLTLEGSSSGIYFLKIQSGNESWAAKLVKK